MLCSHWLHRYCIPWSQLLMHTAQLCLVNVDTLVPKQKCPKCVHIKTKTAYSEKTDWDLFLGVEAGSGLRMRLAWKLQVHYSACHDLGITLYRFGDSWWERWHLCGVMRYLLQRLHIPRTLYATDSNWMAFSVAKSAEIFLFTGIHVMSNGTPGRSGILPL